MTKTFARVMLAVISVIAGKLLFDSFAGIGCCKKLGQTPKKAEEAAAEKTCNNGKNIATKLELDPAALLKQLFAGAANKGGSANEKL